MTREDSYDPKNKSPMENLEKAKQLMEQSVHSKDVAVRTSYLMRADHYSAYAGKQFENENNYAMARKSVKLAKQALIAAFGIDKKSDELRVYDQWISEIEDRRKAKTNVYLDKRLKRKQRDEEHRDGESHLVEIAGERTAAVVAMVGLMGAVLFMNSGVTGNAVALLNASSSSIIGMACLIIALIGAFFYFRKK